MATYVASEAVTRALRNAAPDPPKATEHKFLPKVNIPNIIDKSTAWTKK